MRLLSLGLLLWSSRFLFFVEDSCKRDCFSVERDMRSLTCSFGFRKSNSKFSVRECWCKYVITALSGSYFSNDTLSLVRSLRSAGSSNSASLSLEILVTSFAVRCNVRTLMISTNSARFTCFTKWSFHNVFCSAALKTAFDAAFWYLFTIGTKCWYQSKRDCPLYLSFLSILVCMTCIARSF